MITLSSSCVFTCSIPWARGHDFASRRFSPSGVCAPWFSSSSQSRFQINSAQPQTLCLGFDHWVVMAMQFGSMTTKTKEEDCSGNEVEQIQDMEEISVFHDGLED